MEVLERRKRRNTRKSAEGQITAKRSNDYDENGSIEDPDTIRMHAAIGATNKCCSGNNDDDDDE
jgi:hypothetical protein